MGLVAAKCGDPPRGTYPRMDDLNLDQRWLVLLCRSAPQCCGKPEEAAVRFAKRDRVSLVSPDTVSDSLQ
jgi:hypothetical protein